MQAEKIIRDLEDIIVSGLDSIALPYKKGNSIRIKNYAIRKNSRGWAIYDCKTHSRIAETYFMAGALAIVKNLSEEKNVIHQVVELDRQLFKHYNDVLFFRNTIKTSPIKSVRESRRARLGVSLSKTEYLKKKIDEFIF